MRTREAADLGERVCARIQAGQVKGAYALVAPVLAERTPFTLLGRIGHAIGVCPQETLDAFLEHVASAKTEGGWVIIGCSLEASLSRDLEWAFAHTHAFLVQADIWCATDILAERVPGPALVMDFPRALSLLRPWPEDSNRWVRRATGVAVHYWAKRSRGVKELAPMTEALLGLLDPLFGERDIDAVKGVGWGLKTLGRHYPELVTHWLATQILPGKRPHRALMLRKALTYLSDEQRRGALQVGP